MDELGGDLEFPFTPLYDHIVVEQLPEGATTLGGLVLPQTTQDARGFATHLDGALLRGLVVACGPGDLFLHGICAQCGAGRRVLMDRATLGKCGCGAQEWRDLDTSRAPMQTKPGDVVIYPHRCGTQIELEGKPYEVFHEEQFVLGIVEN